MAKLGDRALVSNTTRREVLGQGLGVGGALAGVGVS